MNNDMMSDEEDKELEAAEMKVCWCGGELPTSQAFSETRNGSARRMN